MRILDLNDDGSLAEFGAIDLSPYGGGPNSVASYGEFVAVAVEANIKQNNGSVVIFDLDGNYLQTISAGALPDMLTFTPDGKYLLVANEGEPSDDYLNDPEGSVTVIDTATWTPVTAGFTAFNDVELKDVRIFGPNASVAQDLEPEYIAVSADSTTAWVSLQENNAMAKLDIASATITDIYGLGYKKHSQKKMLSMPAIKMTALIFKHGPLRACINQMPLPVFNAVTLPLFFLPMKATLEIMMVIAKKNALKT